MHSSTEPMSVSELQPRFRTTTVLIQTTAAPVCDPCLNNCLPQPSTQPCRSSQPVSVCSPFLWHNPSLCLHPRLQNHWTLTSQHKSSPPPSHTHCSFTHPQHEVSHLGFNWFVRHCTRQNQRARSGVSWCPAICTGGKSHLQTVVTHGPQSAF